MRSAWIMLSYICWILMYLTPAVITWILITYTPQHLQSPGYWYFARNWSSHSPSSTKQKVAPCKCITDFFFITNSNSCGQSLKYQNVSGKKCFAQFLLEILQPCMLSCILPAHAQWYNHCMCRQPQWAERRKLKDRKLQNRNWEWGPFLMRS